MNTGHTTEALAVQERVVLRAKPKHRPTCHSGSEPTTACKPDTRQRLLPFKSGWCCEPCPNNNSTCHPGFEPTCARMPDTRQRLLPFKSGWCCEPSPIKPHPAIHSLNEPQHEYQTRKGSCHSRAGGAASQGQTKVNLPFSRQLAMPPDN